MRHTLFSLPLLILALAACSAPPKFEKANRSSGDEEGSEIGNGNQTPGNSEKENDSTPLPEKSEEGDEESPETKPKPDEMPPMEKEKEPEIPLPPPFDPCPEAGKPCVIMPLGDSITWGIQGYDNGGYRVPLIKKAWAANKNITFAGNENTGPEKVDGKPFPRMNEGHPGWTIDDIGGREGISKLVVASLTKHKPHIITLMIGTNDTDINADVANAPKRLANLIDTITQTSPDALVVVAQLVPSRKNEGEARVVAFNAAIPAIVKERADAGKHVAIIDLHSAITANDQWKTLYYQDDLHPKNEGFDVMADAWWTVIGKYFK